jgi:Protein of unknown function (DUF4232)
MHAVTKAGAVAISLTASVVLAGCSSSSSSSSTAASSPTTASSSTPAAPATEPSSTGTAASGSAAGGGAGSTCQPGDLTARLGSTLGSATAATGASGGNPALGQNQFDQIVVLTNSGSSSCTLDGFPGVNLEGTANGSSTYQWALTRSATPYAKVTLQPAGSAHFGIVYLPLSGGNSGTSIKVTTVIATPPNDYSSKQLPWSKTLLLQDAATHPGTWITPVQAGAGGS